MTKDLPNTYSRSTAETAMNPIGQTVPVIHLHLEGKSEHDPSTRHRLLAASGGLFCVIEAEDHHISRAFSRSLSHTYDKKS